ncbi:MAG TPA: nucleotidyl transferase AbiEii/AbiGii toxin family protein, partial [Silvibacterium sp.]|nr:nucleotidyl transferase AbiEii/AbiGii toxin family protein [Silvibacterium sp.]
MTSFLNPYKVDESRALDPVTLHILSVVNRVAAELEIPYIVVGATARDLLLTHVFGIPVMRATADVDFAIAVDTWERFHQLRAALLATGDFRSSTIEHRIYLKASFVAEEIPVDLIPFGGIAEADVIHWPLERETAMTVAGFEDAMAAAVHVQVNDDLTIPVASLAGIAVLKLFAWFDRQTTDKDGLDLYRIISTYADAGNLDRLYGEEIRFIEQAGYDPDLAGAALLGSDARQLCSI